jgi:hypothetical protein
MSSGGVDAKPMLDDSRFGHLTLHPKSVKQRSGKAI